jgi:hypothetical protein
MTPAATKAPEAEKTPDEEPLVERVVGLLSAQYFTRARNYLGDWEGRVLQAARGETVKVTKGEEARLDSLGALLPPGADPRDAQRTQDAKLDAYRAARGDQEALARHQQRLLASQPASSTSEDGGIVRADAPVDEGPAALSQWIKDAQPSSEETVALAEGDPEKARVILEAEGIATGGTPRPEVQEALSKIQG